MRKPPMLLVVALCLLATVQLGASDDPPEKAPAAGRALTVDDYFLIRDVADPQISPDGQWIAYTVTTRDREEDESRSQVWMISTSGGHPIAMTAPEKVASSPRWSPDGRYLAYLAEDEREKTQVWTLFREGGDSAPLTSSTQDVEAYEWSPQGDRMVLVLQDPAPGPAKSDKGDGGGDETPLPWVITRRQFKQDYVGYLDSRRTHLHVLNVESRKLTQITSGDFDDSEPSWSPDGRRIAFTSNRTADPDSNYDTDIWVVAADNTGRGQTLLQVTRSPTADSAPAWSPDGGLIAHISATDTRAIVYATNHLGVTPATGGRTRVLTADLDRNVSDPRFAADGRSILFIVEDSGEQALARIPVGGGSVERPIGGPRSVTAFSLGPGDGIAALVSEPHLPAEIFLATGGGLERVTRTNDELLQGIRLGEVENVLFTSRDGTPIEGFVVKPPGFEPGLRYPTILRIHGGPMLQYDFGFHFEAQLFAANGYVVVLPNPRGSSGYGQAFCSAIWRAWGGVDYEDVMSAVDDVIARGYADSERLGVGGWSYGGMLTSHVITKTDRFKGAYAGAGSANYIVNYGHDEYQRWWESELGLPWRDRELWYELSPYYRVEKVVTPTLILGGEEDWNVPVINSEQLYMALRRLGKTTELVVYPGEHHELETPSYIKDLYERYLAWFGKYVKGTGNAEGGAD